MIIHGDCIEEMKKLKDNSIDLVVIDPPFFMKLDHFKTRTSFQKTLSDLNVIEYFFKDVFKEIERVLKKEGFIYCFCDGQSYPLFWFYLFNFCKRARPLIWDKKTSINGYSWRHQHEIIIFGEMPNSKPIPTGDGDILRYNAVKVNDRKHPAEKPIELLKRFIEKSSKENDVVLDCFMGSGTTGIACKELNRKFIGIEIEERYFKLAGEELVEEKSK